MTDEASVRSVVDRIASAWRSKDFDGLERCFHENAVIVGPAYVQYASGRRQCADSYREFATNAEVLSYSESGHALRLWETTATFTFAWEMTYRRDGRPKTEKGTDELVLQKSASGWQVVWRYVYFEK